MEGAEKLPLESLGAGLEDLRPGVDHQIEGWLEIRPVASEDVPEDPLDPVAADGAARLPGHRDS